MLLYLHLLKKMDKQKLHTVDQATTISNSVFATGFSLKCSNSRTFAEFNSGSSPTPVP